MTRSLALFALPLIACGYNVHYEGRLVDATGAPQTGVAVQIAGLQYERGAPTTTDAIQRMEPTELTTTDDDGHFSIDHYVAQGWFGCGDSDGTSPSLVIAPRGPSGPLLVADSDASNSTDLGTTTLPSEIDAVVGDYDLDVLMPAEAPDGAVVRVDGQGWFASSTLPLTALSPCGTPGSCPHTVSLAWQTGTVHARSSEVTIDAAAPGAFVSMTGAVSFDEAVEVSAIFVDQVFAEGATNAAIPVIHYVAVGEIVASPVPSSACTTYGTGVACGGLSGQVAWIGVEGMPDNASLRVFAHTPRTRPALAIADSAR